MLATYIFTRNGLAVVDGMVSVERAAFWSINGQGVSFLYDHANHLAPGLGYALDIDQLRSISNDVANSEMSDAIKSSFSMALGTLMGIATSPTGPAISLMAGTFASKIFEEAYDAASKQSKQADWTAIYDKLDQIKNEWSGNPDPLNLLSTTSAQMVINQYSTGAGEIVSVKFIDEYGVQREEVAKLSGVAAEEMWLPEQTIRVKMSATGDVTVNPADLVRTIDLSTATLVHSSAITLTSGDFQNALNHAASGLQGNYAGNTVDYANSIVTAAGLSEYGLGSVDYSIYTTDKTIEPGLRVDGLAGHLDPATNAAQYALATSYLLGSQWGTLWNDDVGDVTLHGLAAVMERVGNSIKQQEIKNFSESWSEAGGSPIAIDLNDDGLQTISLAYSQVNFDITGDGVTDRTGWLSPDDAFLTLDRNGNGAVDGVNDLFGGMARGDGYARLSALDSNGDQSITSADTDFSKLKLWRDQNSDGISDNGELFSLQELGVTALGLDYVTQNIRDQGNLLGETSMARMDGRDTAMADVYFRYTTIEEAEMGLYHGRPLRAGAARMAGSSPLAATEEPGLPASELMPPAQPFYAENLPNSYQNLSPLPV